MSEGHRKSYLQQLIEKDKLNYLSDMLRKDNYALVSRIKKLKNSKLKKKIEDDENINDADNNANVIWDGTIINTPTSPTFFEECSDFNDKNDTNDNDDNDNDTNDNDTNDNDTNDNHDNDNNDTNDNYKNDSNNNDNNDTTNDNNGSYENHIKSEQVISNVDANDQLFLSPNKCNPQSNKCIPYYMKFKAINLGDIDEKDNFKLFNQSRMLATEMALAAEDLSAIRTKSESSSRKISRLQNKYGDITYSFSNGAQHVNSCTCERCRKRTRNSKPKNKMNTNGQWTTKEIYIGSNDKIVIENNTIVNGTFKMVGNVKLVIDMFECHNFQRTEVSDFSILWSNHYIKGYCFKSLSRWQRINLFPRSWECTRKDSMARNINTMAHLYGSKLF